MRRHLRQALATIAVAGMILAGCGDGDDADQQPSNDQAETDDQADGTEDDGAAAPEGDAQQDLEELMGDLEDPNEDVEDGVYRGAGVVLPVPDGWTLDQMAFAQGQVVAISDDNTQQLAATAIDTEDLEAAGQPVDLDSLLESIREQIDAEADVDEDVDLVGAERAHQLTFLGLPASQEGGAESSATVLLADDGEGTVGQFSYAAATDDYDEQTAELLVDEAGLDPNSEPIEFPSAPVPEGGAGTEPAPEDDGGTEPAPEDDEAGTEPES